MGWLSNLVFGNPDPRGADDTVLPKSVEDWERSGGGEQKPREPEQTAAARVESPEIDPYEDSSGRKILPALEIVRVEPYLSSDQKRVEIWLTIHNDSKFQIELTHITNFGASLGQNQFFKPGESHKIRTFRGEVLRDHSHTAITVDYKIDENGDYFRCEYVVEYRQRNDGQRDYFEPVDCRRIGPPRDV